MIHILHVVVAATLLIAWVPLAFSVLYLLLLTAAAALPTWGVRDARRLRRFCIVIPAHDEALVLAPVLQQLRVLDYPRDKFDVVVVADNCTDCTPAIARACGARVFERVDPVNRGKGRALFHAFALLSDETFDAYVVLDADTFAATDMLQALNRYLEAGHVVIQGHYDVLNPWESRRTALMHVALRIFNYVRPLGRRNLGLSTGLQGNGMCFAKAVIDRYPWTAYSLAEDIEYTTTLVVNRERIVFAPDVKVAAQMPAERRPATSQRVRWEGGRFYMARRYGFRLIARGLRQLDVRVLDWGADLLIPPLAGLMLLIIGGLCISLLGVALGLLASSILVWAWAGLAIGLVLFVIVALAVGGLGWQGYISLLSAPWYVIWKLWIYLLMLARRTPRTWVRTERTRIFER